MPYSSFDASLPPLPLYPTSGPSVTPTTATARLAKLHSSFGQADPNPPVAPDVGGGYILQHPCALDAWVRQEEGKSQTAGPSRQGAGGYGLGGKEWEDQGTGVGQAGPSRMSAAGWTGLDGAAGNPVLSGSGLRGQGLGGRRNHLQSPYVNPYLPGPSSGSSSIKPANLRPSPHRTNTAPLIGPHTPLFPSYHDVPRLPATTATPGPYQRSLSPPRTAYPHVLPPMYRGAVPPHDPSSTASGHAISGPERHRTLEQGTPLHSRNAAVHPDTSYEDTPLLAGPSALASEGQASGTRRTEEGYSSRAGVKRKQKYKRTRTGCLCCRKRRIKCDESRPTCKKCVIAKRECEFETDEPASRDSDPQGSSEGGSGAEETSPPKKVSPPPSKKQAKQPRTRPQETDQPLFAQDILQPSSPDLLLPQILDELDLPPLLDPQNAEESILGLENMLAPHNSMPGTFGQGTIDTGDFIWDETFVAGYEDPAKEADVGDHGTVDSFAASNDMGQVSQAWGDAGAPRLVSPDFLLPWFPTSEERSLILHYCANAADLMMAIPSGLNPMLAINLPLALDSPRGTNSASDALRVALLGIAAVHQAFLLARSGVSPSQTAGIFQYAAGLRNTGKALVRVAAADPVASRSDAALGAATSLALIDMLFGGGDWQDNFNLARAMIIARGGPAEMLNTSLPTALADGVTVSAARLNLEVLAIYETMGCLTTGQEPLLISDRWANWWFGSSRSTYEEHSVEKQFGMSRKMVHLFARLTRLLSRVQSAMSGGWGTMSGKKAESEMEAGKMNADVDAWIESLQITTLEHERVQVGNRAYAHAMKILLLRNVYIVPRTDIRVQTAATEVLRHCSTSTALLGMSIDLTWPTIIAASCVEGDARQWVLTLFEGFKAQCCFDIETAVRIVREVWVRVDTRAGRDDWRDVCEDLNLRVLCTSSGERSCRCSV